MSIVHTVVLGHPNEFLGCGVEAEFPKMIRKKHSLLIQQDQHLVLIFLPSDQPDQL